MHTHYSSQKAFLQISMKTFNEGQKLNLSYVWGKFIMLTASWHILTMTKTKKGQDIQEESVHV